MLPRGNLDIRWTDLGFGLRACITSGNRGAAQKSVEAAWSTDRHAFCALSVRSGLDTLLTAMNLPPGGEVLTSAMTIEDVPRIISRHGLLAVPVDLDMHTLSVTVAALEHAASPRTCAILVAHLFGSRMSLGEVTAFARRHDLLMIEDCAQAYTGPDYTGHPDSDVSMFSFGTIKTNTALGGAVLKVKDPNLLERMRTIQAQQPVQSRREFLGKVVRCGLLKVASRPTIFGALAHACRLVGTNHDVVISEALHGFTGPGFFRKIRRQPSYPLLALLERRLRTFDPRRIQRRQDLAETARKSMPPDTVVGAGAHPHSHWVFPITSSAPELLTRELWASGLDATRGATSLTVLGPPPDRPGLTATQAAKTLPRMVYLPVHPGISGTQVRRLALIIGKVEAEPDSPYLGAAGRR